MIAGITKAHSGKIERNTDKIAYVPQKLHLEDSFPLKVVEFFQIFNDKIQERDISEAVKLFDATKFLSQNIHTLS